MAGTPKDIASLSGSGQNRTSSLPSISYGAPKASQALNAGKFVVGVSDPTGTLAQSAGNISAGFIGVGKGLVSIVENLPVVGAVAKPLIGFAGGIADATIGKGVSALENVQLGGKSIAQHATGLLETVGDVTVKPALEALAAPEQFVEQKVAEARIVNAQQNKNDIITAIFGNASKEAVALVNNGATVEQAAMELAKKGQGFSEDGAANFVWSLLLDPLNVVLPGVGKVAAIGKEASMLGKIAATARLTAEQAQFLEKWNWAGKVYESTLGKMNGLTRRFSSTLVKEAAIGWTRVHDTKVVGGLLDDIERIVGRKLADRGLNNYAATFYNTIKSAAVKVSAARYRSWSADFADNVISDMADAARGAEKTSAAALKLQAGTSDTLQTLLEKIGFNKAQVNDLVSKIDAKVNAGVRNDELLKSQEIVDIKDSLANLQENLKIAERRDLILESSKYRSGANARHASDDAVRLLREEKINELAIAQNPEKALEMLTRHLTAGFGLTEDVAKQIAERQLAANSGNVRAIADLLAMAKGAAYGQAMREVAAVRGLIRGANAADSLSRLTIISARSLTDEVAFKLRQEIDKLEGFYQEAVRAGDEVAQKSMKEAMQRLADKIVASYDEFAIFANETQTYKDVFRYLKKGKGLVVKELPKAEKLRIAQAAADSPIGKLPELMQRLEGYGYRLGIAPESGLMMRTTNLVADRFGREKFVEMVTPFVDTLDHLDIGITQAGKLDQAFAKAGMRQTGLERIWDKMTRPYGAEVTKSNIAERFVSNMVKKTGISVNQARQIMAEVSSLAYEKGVRPQALFMDRTAVEKIFRDVMKDKYGRLLDAGTEPIKEILDAAAGDWSVAGLTSGFTGRVKAWKPEITVLTDIIYPEVRFGKLNPYFNLILERVETNIQLRVYGIKKEFAKETLNDVQGTVARRAYLSNLNVNREINDAVLDKLVGRTAKNLGYAAKASPAFAERVQQRLRGLRQFFSRENLKDFSSIEIVKENKRIARDIMTDKFAASEFMDILERVAPGKINELALHYGVTNANDAIENLLAEYMIHSDPIHFAAHVAEYGKSARGFSVEALVKSGMDEKAATELAGAVVGAYEEAILRGSRLADKAQYFASQRSWLERSLNHPFLGMYPYSYMVQKAIPSVLRIMFAPKVFGHIAPGFGYNMWRKTQEAMQNQLNTDQSVVGQLVKNDALLWLLTTILPTTPDSSGFSAPAWLRRGIIQPGLRGEDITLADLGGTLTEVGSTVVRGTALGQLRSTLEGVQSAADILNVNESLSQGIQGTTEQIQSVVRNQLRSDIRNP